MLRHITIRNFGPINEVDIEIKRLNIFIGPQSSGKSTIAKCISFGLWLEKEISLHQSADHIDQDFINKQFLIYHKLDSYVQPDSLIRYKCDFFTFQYNDGKSTLTANQDLIPAHLGKVSYIPSERNIVSLPNISSLKLGADYMRDFLFDWLLLRSKFTSTDPLPILNLGVKYYYDENLGDRIILKSGKEISLYEASSGLQSAVPMIGSVIYNTQWVFENEADMSFDKHILLRKNLLKRLHKIDPSFNAETIGQDLDNGDMYLVEVTEKGEAFLPKHKMLLNDILDVYATQLNRPVYSALIIEEPEQNLFPLTQYESVKHIASAYNSHPDNVFVVTTHSPYVMSSFNNLIEAHHVIARLNISVPDDGIDHTTAIDHNQLAAYSLHDGQATSIFDNEVELISAEALDSASYQIEADFNQMLSR